MTTKKITFIALSITLAMILSYVESKIPVFVAIPGIKAGLPNLIIIFTLYKVGWKETIAVSIVRVLLVSILFGNVQSMVFSLSGAALSLTGMILLKNFNWLSCITVSIIGGILHNIGQIIIACIWTQTSEIVFYLPVLLITGTVAGCVIGLLAGLLVKRLDKWNIQ